MKAHLLSRRTFYLAAVVAIVASTSGFALASVLTPPTTVTQNSSFYSGTNAPIAGYGAPTLEISAVPAGVVACSAATVIDASSGGTANLYLSAYTGASNCTAGNFAEEYIVDYNVAASAAHVDNFTIYSQAGAGAEQTNFGHIQLGGGAFTASIQIYVCYGAVMPPNGGVTELELLIHHP